MVHPSNFKMAISIFGFGSLGSFGFTSFLLTLKWKFQWVSSEFDLDFWLKNKIKELKNQIIYKDISLAKTESKIIIKLKEIQVLQSKIKELKMKYLLVQKDLLIIDFLRRKLAQTRQNVELKNIDLDLKEEELSEKKHELMQIRNNLALI
ncbi:hypothetical protein C1645_873243 [Glomus cerebriforme]|uniref:Uncharacterized protein n=1 Tax=Glomus cerebriforme TaxID=658196 RepID=A0A397TDY3_9GLOM|nr:hypothetical protein C1645_873243 [Glomus cerebriforme]